MYNQYRGLNALMSFTVANALMNQFEGWQEYKLKTDITKAKKKELDITELEKQYAEAKENRTNYANEFYDMFLKNSYQVLSQLPFRYSYTKSLISNKIKADFNTMAKGILRGDVRAVNYKRTFPLMVQNKDLKFEFVDNNVFIKYVMGIQFKVVKPTKKHYKNYKELQSVLDNIENENYEVKQSSFQFDKNNHLILNLTLDIPEKDKSEKIVGKVVGVDLGIKVPAYCALNDSEYERKPIGSFDDCMKIVTEMKNRRRKLYKVLKFTNDGKGRKKKLQAIDRLANKQRNFMRTYNEKVSKEVVEFAIRNQAEQINLEELKIQKKKGRSMLDDWGYYQLGQMIERKAERVGIIVNYVNPAYTSQTCSVCGNCAEEQRINQAEFVCSACGAKLNADYNATRNIAMSTNVI